MKITTQVHTIFLLIGPTESGKTTFTKEVLLPQLSFQAAEKISKPIVIICLQMTCVANCWGETMTNMQLV